MKKLFFVSVIFGFLCVVSTAVYGVAAEGATPAPQEGSSWKAAGEEIGEAAHAVQGATADSSKQIWDETKKESAEAWNAAKKGSAKAWEAAKKQGKSAWEEGKASIHEVTAPASATAPAPVAPETD